MNFAAQMMGSNGGRWMHFVQPMRRLDDDGDQRRQVSPRRR